MKYIISFPALAIVIAAYLLMASGGDMLINGDAYSMNLASGAEQVITTDGDGLITWATAEFIAQEELDRDTGYWWSPDERFIALQRTDETQVDVIPRLDITGGGASVTEQRYPRAGRPNAVVELYVQDVQAGQRVKVDLGADADIYLARVNWAKDGRTLYVQRLSRDQKTLDLLKGQVLPALGAADVVGDNRICKVSIVGIGMRSHVGVASRMFKCLSDEGINIQMISTSEIKTSVVIDEKYMELAVRALHREFDLDQPQDSLAKA